MQRTLIINFVMQVQPSEVVDVHFFKPNKNRSSKEAQVDAHLAEKRQEVLLLNQSQGYVDERNQQRENMVERSLISPITMPDRVE